MRFFVLFAALVPVGASAQPPKPTTAPTWTVNYALHRCEVQRSASPGRVAIKVTLTPHSPFQGMAVSVPTVGRRPSMETITLSLPAPDIDVPPTALISPSADKTASEVAFSLTQQQLASAMKAGSFTVSAKRIGTIDVDTRGLGKAVEAAKPCVDDLANRWGAPRTWAVDAVAERTLIGLFTADDYPETLRSANKQGTLQALLRLDANGKVIGCRGIDVVGDVAFVNVSCKILAQRARFTPAKDASGAPTESFYLTPKLSWLLG